MTEPGDDDAERFARESARAVRRPRSSSPSCSIAREQIPVPSRPIPTHQGSLALDDLKRPSTFYLRRPIGFILKDRWSIKCWPSRAPLRTASLSGLFSLRDAPGHLFIRSTYPTVARPVPLGFVHVATRWTYSDPRGADRTSACSKTDGRSMKERAFARSNDSRRVRADARRGRFRWLGGRRSGAARFGGVVGFGSARG